MTDHRGIVGRGFRIGGWVLGVPSAAGLLAVGVSLLLVRSPDDKSTYLDIGKYGIAGLLANGAKGVGGVLDWFGGIGVWLEKLLAAGFAAALLFAVMLYFTGRGIARHAKGAGEVGIGLSALFALFWLVVLLSTSRSAMAVPVAGLMMTGYSIWALGRR